MFSQCGINFRRDCPELLKLKHADANGQNRPSLCALILCKEQTSRSKSGGIKCFLKTKNTRKIDFIC